MKTKKFISILMAIVIMLSTIIWSMPTTIAAIKSGNANESEIETNVYPAHYIQGNDNVTPKYPSQITEANGWTVDGKNASISTLEEGIIKDNKRIRYINYTKDANGKTVYKNKTTLKKVPAEQIGDGWTKLINGKITKLVTSDKTTTYTRTSATTDAVYINMVKNVTYKNGDKESITAQIKRVKSSGDQFYLSRTRTYTKKDGEKYIEKILYPTEDNLKDELEKDGGSVNYHYVILDSNNLSNAKITSNISIGSYTAFLVKSGITLDLNKNDINLEGDNILVSGEGSNSSLIKNGQIKVNKDGTINIAIKRLKLGGATYNKNTNKIVLNTSCSNISITDCALNNNSTDSSNSFGGRILCNATVKDLYVVNCSADGESPYLIRTSANGSISNLKISRSSDNASKLCGKVSLSNNSNNIKITNQDNLNYSFKNCNTISFTSSSINNIAFNGCKTFRLHSTNINGDCTITSCNVFSLLDVPIKGKAEFTNSYYFEFNKAGDSCLKNVLYKGLTLTNCRNFILNETKIPVGLTVENDTTNTYCFFSIKNSYVNNVYINHMQHFTIYQTCKKSTPKNYSLSNCKYYKNYVVRTSATNAQIHNH